MRYHFAVIRAGDEQRALGIPLYRVDTAPVSLQVLTQIEPRPLRGPRVQGMSRGQGLMVAAVGLNGHSHMGEWLLGGLVTWT